MGSRTRTASLAVGTAALAGLTGLSLAGGAGAQTPPKRCAGSVQAVKANNVQAIIDDSYSMRASDSDRLRLAGLELFISDRDNRNKTLGVVEFGTAANTVFAPARVGDSRGTMIARLRAQVQGDNGETNYNSGFVKAAQDNAGAQARIFITDGADDGGYANTHRGGPRTFVVGLDIGRPSPTNAAANRLQQIADETGGVYFLKITDSTLQPTVRTISLAINCLPRPRTFRSRLFRKRGQKSVRTVRIPRSTKEIELALNWARPGNRFSQSGVTMLSRRNRVLATLTGRGKPRKLRTTKFRARTFRSVRFKRPTGATKLRFTVKAQRVVRRERKITQLTERE